MDKSMTMSKLKGDEILYKEIMTMDMVYLGYVAAAEYNDIIVISKGTKQEYRIPKSKIIRYDDTKVLLNILSKGIEQIHNKLADFSYPL
jgi:hypothetical protein